MFKCSFGVFDLQCNSAKKSAPTQTNAPNPAMISRKVRAADFLGVGGSDNRLKHGGHASLPSSSVTHSRQNVPPQCGHRAAASLSE